MTCISAITQDGVVWMGGDSAGVSDDFDMCDCSESKVWKQGDLLLGSYGSFRVAQVIRYHMVAPAFDSDQDALEFVVTDVVDAMKVALEECGALSIWHEDSTVSMDRSGLLVAVGGRLFDLFEDFGVGEYRDGFAAVGCGGPFALGSLWSTTGKSPKKRIELSLQAAERFSAGVRGPFTILSTDK